MSQPNTQPNTQAAADGEHALSLAKGRIQRELVATLAFADGEMSGPALHERVGSSLRNVYVQLLALYRVGAILRHGTHGCYTYTLAPAGTPPVVPEALAIALPMGAVKAAVLAALPERGHPGLGVNDVCRVASLTLRQVAPVLTRLAKDKAIVRLGARHTFRYTL